MAVIRCNQGHYYDNAKYDRCPHCERSQLSNGAASFTQENKTVKNQKKNCDIDEFLNTRSLKNTVNQPDSEGKTVSIYFKEKNMNPVSGWLVCTFGENKGRSFEIHIGKNFIGRSMKMDIHSNDGQVSRENHVSIIFEPKSCKFYLLQGNGMTYCNGNLLADSLEIFEGDELEIGQSKYVFVPFCREGRDWSE